MLYSYIFVNELSKKHGLRQIFYNTLVHVHRSKNNFSVVVVVKNLLLSGVHYGTG